MSTLQKVLFFLLYLILVFILWIGLIIINHLILVKLSLVRFKDVRVTEVDSYIGNSFDILLMTSLVYILLLLSQFFYFKEKKWISYLSIGLWIVTIIGIYVWNK
jgi:hypothetical protein